MSALKERRRAAREAFEEEWSPWDAETVTDARDVAIETATRVRITPEIIEAHGMAGRWSGPGERRAIIIAAFKAAGFEVEE